MITSNIFIPLIVVSILFGIILFLKPDLIKNKKILRLSLIFFSIAVILVVIISIYNTNQARILQNEINRTNESLEINYDKIDSTKRSIIQTIESPFLKEALDTIDISKIEEYVDSSYITVDENSKLNRRITEAIEDSSVISKPLNIKDSLYSQIENINLLILKTKAEINNNQMLAAKLSNQVKSAKMDFYKGNRSSNYEFELRKTNYEIERLNTALRNLIIQREILLTAANNVYK
jgi:hypothetical protein